ncbi:ATP-binding protein [Pleionea sp. CnH1-48]|uniref:sensor histidine kinase n=1 Tax=Pleionea sp. CnH1-48 TaxID=2954494 RepID=UPI0020976D71|nr:ATP-binding protein [Pleionea sp. CnH1-48]MCO7225885.1 ATP-binding protein [Pleionea sp. CnH1-48]
MDNDNTHTQVTSSYSHLDCAGKSDDALQQLIYSLSHDLSAPLRQVSGFSEMLKSTYTNELDDKAVKWFSFVIEGSEKMHSMLDALLIYSRIWTQDSVFEEIDLKSLIESEWARLAVSFRDRDRERSLHIDDNMPSIIGIRAQWSQLIFHLLSNCLNYTPRDYELVIEVKLLQDGENIGIAFDDNGKGIDARKHDRYRQLFARGVSDKECAGLGMGLAYVSRIIERHGGELVLDTSANGGLSAQCWLKSEYKVAK